MALNPTRTYDPPLGTCTRGGFDGEGFPVPPLELSYTFQGIDFFVQVFFKNKNFHGFATSDTLCFGTIRTLQSFTELPNCQCTIRQYPKRAFFGSAFVNLACSPDPFLGFPETPCPNCSSFGSIDNPLTGFVYFDNKKKRCIEYVYDAQTGTYTVRIL